MGPGPTDKLSCTVLNKTTMRLSWNAPVDNGGAEVSSYTIEKRETSHLAWTLVASDVNNTSYKVQNLFEGNEYIFRVAAVNKYGKGEIVECKPAKAKNLFDVASRPGIPEVSNIVDGSCTVTWTRPMSTGGVEIENYVLEKRDKDGSRWVRAQKKRISECRTRVSGLQMGRTYEFRVAAENAAGLSEYSDGSPYFTMVNPIYPPSAPSSVSITTSTNTSITLGWTEPNYDGGSEILGYQVEYAELVENEEDEEWKQITIRNLDGVYTIPGLSELKEYKIKVASFNRQAMSEAKSAGDPYKPHVIYVEPAVEVDCSLKQFLKVKAGMILRICGKLSGNPMPTVSWKKDNMPLPDRAF